MVFGMNFDHPCSPYLLREFAKGDILDAHTYTKCNQCIIEVKRQIKEVEE